MRSVALSLIVVIAALLAGCDRHAEPAGEAGVLKVASQRGGTRALMEAAGAQPEEIGDDER